MASVSSAQWLLVRMFIVHPRENYRHTVNTLYPYANQTQWFRGGEVVLGGQTHLAQFLKSKLLQTHLICQKKQKNNKKRAKIRDCSHVKSNEWIKVKKKKKRNTKKKLNIKAVAYQQLLLIISWSQCPFMLHLTNSRDPILHMHTHGHESCTLSCTLSSLWIVFASTAASKNGSVTPGRIQYKCDIKTTAFCLKARVCPLCQLI